MNESEAFEWAFFFDVWLRLGIFLIPIVAAVIVAAICLNRDPH